MAKSVSILDSSISVVGDIISSGCIDVCANINGKVITDVISIKDNGNINGDIFANEIILTNNSVVNGNIVAKTIKMFNGASVNGSIIYNILSMEDGAKIAGDVRYADKEQLENLIEKAKDKDIINENQDINN